jgi:hypothetical protein
VPVGAHAYYRLRASCEAERVGLVLRDARGAFGGCSAIFYGVNIRFRTVKIAFLISRYD